MNILIINFEYPPLGGGGGVATKQIAEQLAKKHDVHILTSASAETDSEESSGRLKVHRVRVFGRHDLATASLTSMAYFVPAALWRGWKLCRQVKFDVINAQFVLPSGIPAVILTRIFRIPFVLSFIGGDVYDPTKKISPHRHVFFRWLIRVIAARADHCTAISEDTKQKALQLHGVACDITVTHLGLEPGEPPKKSRAQLGLPENACIAVTVGRLIPRKGYDVLLRAWSKVPDAYLIVIGDGPLKQDIYELASRLAIEKRVHISGYVPEERKKQILRVADFYVSAARHEGFGIVFLEAMDAGLPVIATDNGGQRDFLKDGANGYLVPVDDPERLRSAIEKLIANPQLRKEMGGYNKRAVCGYYIDRTTQTFERVLEKANGAYEHRN